MSQIIAWLFKFLCFSATIFMITYWCVEYLKDNDLASVDYKTIKNVSFVNPMLSLCFENPFLEEKLKSVSSDLNKSVYLDFLKGKVDDNGILHEIDYSNVTLNIENSLKYYYIFWKNESGYVKYPASNKDLVRPTITYNGFLNDHFKKCFGFGLEPHIMKDVRRVKKIYVADIFQEYPGHQRPIDGSFSALIHYPNQFLLRAHTEKLGWRRKVANNESMFMHFKVDMIDYFRRRSKRQQPCMPNENEFDIEIISRHNKIFGCRALYDTLDSNLPFCKGMENISRSVFDGKKADLDEVDPPCDSVLDITLEYDEFDDKEKDGGYIIAITYPDRVKVIQQSKEISFHGLVGNSGGYIGLFLGKWI